MNNFKIFISQQRFLYSILKLLLKIIFSICIFNIVACQYQFKIPPNSTLIPVHQTQGYFIEVDQESNWSMYKIPFEYLKKFDQVKLKHNKNKEIQFYQLEETKLKISKHSNLMTFFNFTDKIVLQVVHKFGRYYYTTSEPFQLKFPLLSQEKLKFSNLNSCQNKNDTLDVCADGLEITYHFPVVQQVNFSTQIQMYIDVVHRNTLYRFTSQGHLDQLNRNSNTLQQITQIQSALVLLENRLIKIIHQLFLKTSSI